MSIVVKNKFVEEDILDEKGNVLGQVRFNPDDTRIMQKLTKIMNNLGNKYKEIKNIQSETNLEKLEKLESVEDFENVSDVINKISNAYDIENDVIASSIKELEEIFTTETIELFTHGTNDFESLYPLLEFISPYVANYKKEKINGYIVSETDNDVME